MSNTTQPPAAPAAGANAHGTGAPVPVDGAAPGAPGAVGAPGAAPGAASAAGAAGQQPHLSASLYVGDLLDDTTEPVLFETFSAVGPVASIRVCRDAVSRRSLGYAYVNFHNMVDAERALDTLNYQPIRGKPCRIMWKHRDPSARKSGKNNVFVKNLDKEIDSRMLHDTFSQFGNIVSCKVAMDENNSSKGFGFVQYETDAEAEQACKRVNGMLIKEKVVYVGPFVPASERDGSASATQFTNVYVKNFDEVSNDDFEGKFAEYGEVSSAIVMRDGEGKSKGFGFVNFVDHDEAERAIEALKGTKTWGDRELYLGRAEKKRRRQQDLKQKWEARRLEQQAKWRGVNLYVKNLDDQCDDTKLREGFAQFGTITSARIMKDDKGVTRGFGFVCFSSPEEATRAVTAMNGQMFGAKPIYVALHQSKEVRKAQLEAQYNQRQQQMNPNMNQGGPGQPVLFAPPGVGGAGVQPGRQVLVYPQMAMPQQPRWPMNQPMAVPNVHRQQRGRYNQNRNQSMGNNIQKGPPRNQRPPHVQHQQPLVQNVPQPAAAAAVPTTNEPLTASALASMDQDQQKQVLGERLYASVSKKYPERAGKITGMLLEGLEIGELLNLLDAPDALESKCTEAIDALKKHTENKDE